MTEIAPSSGNRFLKPAVEIFVGIPSVVYGWIGLTILIPFLKAVFHLNQGFSVLAAGIVLAVMIFPSIKRFRRMRSAAFPWTAEKALTVWGLPDGRSFTRLCFRLLNPVS